MVDTHLLLFRAPAADRPVDDPVAIDIDVAIAVDIGVGAFRDLDLGVEAQSVPARGRAVIGVVGIPHARADDAPGGMDVTERIGEQHRVFVLREMGCEGFTRSPILARRLAHIEDGRPHVAADIVEDDEEEMDLAVPSTAQAGWLMTWVEGAR